MDKITSFMGKFPGWLQALGFSLSIIMICAAGLLMMTGRSGSEKGKSMLAFVLIGLGVVYLAAQIAGTVQSGLQ